MTHQNAIRLLYHELVKAVLLEWQVHVHCMSPFFFLRGISGLFDGYPSRAMVFPGVCATGANSVRAVEDLEACHAYLRSIELGAKRLVLVPGFSPSAGIVRSSEIQRQIRRYLDAGLPLDLFISRMLDRLLHRLGLKWDDTVAPNPVHANQFDDKLLAHLRFPDLFPAWCFVRKDPESVARARQRVLDQAEVNGLATNTVFLKVHDHDGGEGILRWGPDTDQAEVAEFVVRYIAHGFLVEAGYPANVFNMTEVSVQLAIGEQAHRVLYPTLQITKGDAHQGNEMILGADLLPAKLWRKIKRVVDPIGREAVANHIGRGRVRTIGVDLLVVRSAGEDHVFVIEVNARRTAAVANGVIAAQAIDRFGDTCAVITENTTLETTMDFQSVVRNVINGHLWDGSNAPGIVPSNAGSLRVKKITLNYVAQTLTAARDLKAGQDDWSAFRTRARSNRVFLPSSLARAAAA